MIYANDQCANGECGHRADQHAVLSLNDQGGPASLGSCLSPACGCRGYNAPMGQPRPRMDAHAQAPNRIIPPPPVREMDVDVPPTPAAPVAGNATPPSVPDPSWQRVCPTCRRPLDSDHRPATPAAPVPPTVGGPMPPSPAQPPGAHRTARVPPPKTEVTP
jgi:hypothetical protein